MNTLIVLGSVWGVITILFVGLLLYRRGLVNQESAWIPLTDDAREDKAIQAQTVIEMKTRKLTVPIRILGTLSLVMLLVIVGFWLFHTLFTPPPMPQ
jgi:predicted permease